MGVWKPEHQQPHGRLEHTHGAHDGRCDFFNQLTLQANSYLFMGSGVTTQILALQGNVVQGGTLAGTEPAGISYSVRCNSRAFRERRP